MNKPRVIVIDDETLLREVIVMALNDRGYPAMGISNPEDAERTVAFWGASVVLCDICMPQIDGMEVTRRLKEINPGTQVILMTGFPGPESVEEAAELGADGYLIKPFESIDSLCEAIDKALRHVWDWKETMRESIRHEFPEEYNIIYSGAGDVPCEEELALLIAQMSDQQRIAGAE